jgi:hypothetical protein
MNDIFSYTTLMIRYELFKNLPREAEHYRLVKAAARPRPKRLQKIAAALHKAMVGPTRDSQRLRSAAKNRYQGASRPV